MMFTHTRIELCYEAPDGVTETLTWNSFLNSVKILVINTFLSLD